MRRGTTERVLGADEHLTYLYYARTDKGELSLMYDDIVCNAMLYLFP
jgi:hypothetical protein